MASGSTTRSSRQHRLAVAAAAPKFAQARLSYAAFVAGVGVWLVVQPAQAQQTLLLDQFITPDVPGYNVAPGVTVTSRARPEYAYQGVRVGGFVLRPELLETFGYSTNVTGTNPARGSAVIETNATMQALSDWSRNSLGISFTVNDNRFLDEPRQSFTNWTASVGGTYDVGRDTVSLAASHQNLNQTPRDLDTVSTDQVIPYRVDSIRAGYRAVFNRFTLRPELDVSRYDYDNATVRGVTFQQTYRNRVVVSPAITAQYELAPRRNVVFVVRDSTATYSNQLPGSPKRDFNDVAALAGIDYEASGALRYRILAGYQVRFFSDQRLRTIQAPVVEASAIWTPTGLTTVTGAVTRRIQDSAEEVTAGVTNTGLRLTLDHEYLRNVLLRATGGVFVNEYDQNGGTQSLQTVGVGATWLLNRNMRVGATYDFTSRQSGGNGTVSQGQRFGSSYTENRYLLQLRLGL